MKIKNCDKSHVFIIKKMYILNTFLIKTKRRVIMLLGLIGAGMLLTAFNISAAIAKLILMFS